MLRRLAAVAILMLIASTSVTAMRTTAQVTSDATPIAPEQTPIADDAQDSVEPPDPEDAPGLDDEQNLEDPQDPDQPRPLVTPEQVPTSLEPASQYCVLRDGILVERFPFAALESGDPVALSGSRWFCEFTGSADADPPSSRISVALTTLYATEPTLAAMAYAATVQIEVEESESTPAEAYCQAIGGSSSFGYGSDRLGGWASDVDSPETTAISICMFPDGSAIDDWGLYYHSVGTIRGTDLGDSFRYDSDSAGTEIFAGP